MSGRRPALQWDGSMLVYSLEVSSIPEAATKLPFVPIASLTLGDPISIFVSDPAAVPVEDRAISLTYQHPSYGRFVLGEQLSQTTQQELEALADGCDPSQGCEGTWTIVTIRETTKALLVAGPGSTFMSWLVGPIRINLLGPPDTFDTSEAMAVANSV